MLTVTVCLLQQPGCSEKDLDEVLQATTVFQNVSKVCSLQCMLGLRYGTLRTLLPSLSWRAGTTLVVCENAMHVALLAHAPGSPPCISFHLISFSYLCTPGCARQGQGPAGSVRHDRFARNLSRDSGTWRAAGGAQCRVIRRPLHTWHWDLAWVCCQPGLAQECSHAWMQRHRSL